MAQTFTTELLFDDLSLVEAMPGAGNSNLSPATDYNDCTNNLYAAQDDEQLSTPESARAAA